MDTKKFTLACALVTNTPVVLWGQPGIGKSATIEALGRSLGLPVRTVIAAIHDPTDFSGIPVPDLERGRARYLPPEWAVDLVEAGKGILFLDEISTAPPAVQAALLQVVLNRRVGSLQLPEQVRVVAAANPPDQAAGGFELSPPLANRFAHIDWAVEAGELVRGLTQGWDVSLPRIGDWKAKLPAATAIVAAYLHSRPDREVQPPQPGILAYPTWRSWEMAVKMLAAALTVTEDTGLLAQVVGSCVGSGDGIGVAAVLNEGSLPTPEEILAGAALPERPDRLFASLFSLATYVLAKKQEPDFPELWARAWDVLVEAAKQQAPDIAAIAAGQLVSYQIDCFVKGLPCPDIPPGALKPFDPIIRAARRRKEVSR